MPSHPETQDVANFALERGEGLLPFGLHNTQSLSQLKAV